MITEEQEIEDLKLFTPKVFEDRRGFFFESFKQEMLDVIFVQDNHSYSKKNVLRGLHYQIKHPQGKLVRVTSGTIYDVAVDLRKSSPTFGMWKGVYLSSENKNIFWVPPGFGHGFVVLSDGADVLYKATDVYCPKGARSIRWDDPGLGISWPIEEEPVLSEQDAAASSLKEAELFS